MDALSFLSQRNPFIGETLEIPQWKYLVMLMEFEEYKGTRALEALAGFYLYCVDKKRGDERSRLILSCFAHDLGGRNDKWMEPRSSSYHEFWLRFQKQ